MGVGDLLLRIQGSSRGLATTNSCSPINIFLLGYKGTNFFNCPGISLQLYLFFRHWATFIKVSRPVHHLGSVTHHPGTMILMGSDPLSWVAGAAGLLM